MILNLLRKSQRVESMDEEGQGFESPSTFFSSSSSSSSCVSKGRVSEVLVSFGVVLAALVFAVGLQQHFDFLCGLIGSVVTMVNSIILPIAFFHALQPDSTSAWKILVHTILLVLAAVIVAIGLSMSVCSFAGLDNQYCHVFDKS